MDIKSSNKTNNKSLKPFSTLNNDILTELLVDENTPEYNKPPSSLLSGMSHLRTIQPKHVKGTVNSEYKEKKYVLAAQNESKTVPSMNIEYQGAAF